MYKMDPIISRIEVLEEDLHRKETHITTTLKNHEDSAREILDGPFGVIKKLEGFYRSNDGESGTNNLQKQCLTAFSEVESAEKEILEHQHAEKCLRELQDIYNRLVDKKNSSHPSTNYYPVLQVLKRLENNLRHFPKECKETKMVLELQYLVTKWTNREIKKVDSWYTKKLIVENGFQNHVNQQDDESLQQSLLRQFWKSAEFLPDVFQRHVDNVVKKVNRLISENIFNQVENTAARVEIDVIHALDALLSFVHTNFGLKSPEYGGNRIWTAMSNRVIKNMDASNGNKIVQLDQIPAMLNLEKKYRDLGFHELQTLETAFYKRDQKLKSAEIEKTLEFGKKLLLVPTVANVSPNGKSMFSIDQYWTDVIFKILESTKETAKTENTVLLQKHHRAIETSVMLFLLSRSSGLGESPEPTLEFFADCNRLCDYLIGYGTSGNSSTTLKRLLLKLALTTRIQGEDKLRNLMHVHCVTRITQRMKRIPNCGALEEVSSLLGETFESCKNFMRGFQGRDRRGYHYSTDDPRNYSTDDLSNDVQQDDLYGQVRKQITGYLITEFASYFWVFQENSRMLLIQEVMGHLFSIQLPDLDYAHFREILEEANAIEKTKE